MPKKSTSKSSSKATKKKATTKKKSTRKSAARQAPKTVTKEVIVEKHSCYHEPTEEHRVFSHVMYILFLFAGAIAAYYTFAMWLSMDARLTEDVYLPVKALVVLGWAYFFKTFAHRIHHPHH